MMSCPNSKSYFTKGSNLLSIQTLSLSITTNYEGNLCVNQTTHTFLLMKFNLLWVALTVVDVLATISNTMKNCFCRVLLFSIFRILINSNYFPIDTILINSNNFHD